jgi:hypothetical protein
MSQTSIHTSSLKDNRRILGEKNANACLSPARSPIKRALAGSSSPKKLLPSPSFIAQKRPTGQVDQESENSARGLLRFQRVETRVPAAVAPVQHGVFEQMAADGEVRVSELLIISRKYRDLPGSASYWIYLLSWRDSLS